MKEIDKIRIRQWNQDNPYIQMKNLENAQPGYRVHTCLLYTSDPARVERQHIQYDPELIGFRDHADRRYYYYTRTLLRIDFYADRA